MTEPLLEIKNLSLRFAQTEAASGVSLSIPHGARVALVGESGSGKSVTALSVLQLLPNAATLDPASQIIFKGHDLLKFSERDMRRLRGERISMVFQEPMSSLNPLHKVDRQIGEVLRGRMRKKARAAYITELLDQAGFADAQHRLHAYPHELSGGQRQRVMIAMALANAPDLLIADEPTTALDVTVQAQILESLRGLGRERNMSIFFITHDLDIVRAFADHVYVMHEGRIVEGGSPKALFARPKASYTKRLIESQPSGAPLAVRESAPTLARVENLTVRFAVKSGIFRRETKAVLGVDHVSFFLREGHTLGVVGESGSGKTSLALALLRLLSSEGDIVFGEESLHQKSPQEMRSLRASMQIVFQDPYGSLSPRMSVGSIITEGLEVHRAQMTREALREKASELLREVGLEPEMQDRYPHEFSGGQRQRIAIARALALAPKLVVLDEPTSGLDVSVQAKIIDLLRDLQERHKLSYLFISHNLRVVRALAHEVAVMRRGRIIEFGEAEDIFENPTEDYTQALLKAAFA